MRSVGAIKPKIKMCTTANILKTFCARLYYMLLVLLQ